MSYSVLYIPPFQRQLKRLAKKYPSIKKDFSNLLDELTTKPDLGTPIGQQCFKIRMSISSKGRGKSGGARVITTVYVAHRTVYLLSIYDKGQQETVNDKELIELLKMIPKT